MIAALIEMDVTSRRWIVECPRYLNDIIHITGDWLIWCQQCRNILHPRAHGIKLQIDLPFPGKTDGSGSPPGFLAIFLHQETVNADTIKTAAGRKLQAVKRLFENRTMLSQKIHRHLRIGRVTMDGSLEVSQPTHIDIAVQLLQQRQVHMPTIKSQIQLRIF